MHLLDLIVAGGWPIWIIPFVSAFVGWWTNAVAVQMMFRPTEFVGVRPWLGWQGIVPASARRLAEKSADLMLGQLMTVRDLFAGFDAEKMSGDLAPALDRLTDEVLTDAMARHAPETWGSMAEPARQAIRGLLRAEIGETAKDILADLHADAEAIIDLKKVILAEVERNKVVISEMFQTVGYKEFQFVKASGVYFGLPFGALQMLQWAAAPAWWTLPVAGFAVGYATNWLAVRLVFSPREPVRVGPFTVQGLFHKRQQEVAAAYAQDIATKVMNPENIVRTITQGEHGAVLFGIVRRHVGALLDKYEQHPMASMLFPPDARGALRAELFTRIEAELGKAGGFLHEFVRRAMDIRGELFRRMSKLDSRSFEGVLRPAFQQDEWKLILAGAVLGLAAGFAQLVLCFPDVWRAV